MNRLVGWLSLDGSGADREKLEACPFQTPHWRPDHQDIYVDRALAMSSTQRFITPQCSAGLMPYQDANSGCVINADVYLTNRESLCEALASDSQISDAELILKAYLKWDEDCTRHLAGNFCFMIWDSNAQKLFAAVDPFAQCPIFYIHRPRAFLMLANECSPFHVLHPQLKLDPRRFIEFSKDLHSPTKGAYQEIRKLPPGHQMVATAKSLRQTCYWRWKDQKQKLPYQTREEFYEAAQNYFEQAVKKSLRRIGPLTSQVSGGLDSSAVTAQAAELLARRGESLTAFTILPHGLSGQSYRPGWYYHELPRIEELLKQYPNIQLVVYKADPSSDIFERLKPLQRSFDQPLRNMNNFDWTLGCYEQVLKQEGRVLLIGTGGNGTISFAGGSKLNAMRNFYSMLKAKLLFRRHRWIRSLHETMLSGRLTAPLRSSVYALQLWYGVRRLDPTQEIDLSVFCYNVPSWVYRRGNEPREQRLLTREGLRNLLPAAIAENPYRGEQGADWYLHYNHNREAWRDRLKNLSPRSQAVLWKSYNQEKIMSLFDEYSHFYQPPDRKASRDLGIQLLRCLSVASYLDA